MYSELASLEMSVNLNKISAKQLICQCLDITSTALKSLIAHYHGSTSTPMPQEVGRDDFQKAMSYCIDAQNMDRVLEFMKVDDLGDRQLIRNCIHDLRNIRNIWAHSNALQYRLAHRAFDTLETLLCRLKCNKQTDEYKKVNNYRKMLIVKMAQDIVKEESVKTQVCVPQMMPAKQPYGQYGFPS